MQTNPVIRRPLSGTRLNCKGPLAAAQQPSNSRGASRSRVLVTVVALLLLGGCQHAEPRWLIDRLPGNYPEVTYYFPMQSHHLALTIDDGPDPLATPAILRVLAEHEVHATFFLVSDKMKAHPELVQQIIDGGHELGNHMTRDRVTSKLSPEEFLQKFLEANREVCKYRCSHWFRPGSAWYNDSMKETLEDHNYRIVLASMIPFDARLPWPRFMSGYITWSVEPGSIIVLHSVGKRGLRTVATLERALPVLAKRGYVVDTLTATDALVPQAGPKLAVE